MVESVVQTEVWLKTKDAADTLSVSVETVNNYKKHLRNCGVNDVPKHGVYQSQLFLMMRLKEEIQINGVSKAKLKIRQIIQENKKQQQQEVTENV